MNPSFPIGAQRRGYLSAPSRTTRAYHELPGACCTRQGRWCAKSGLTAALARLNLATTKSAAKLYSCLLPLLVRQQPDQRFIVQVHHLNAIAEWVTEIAAETGNQLQSVFLGDLLAHFNKLVFISHHDAEMPHLVRLH